MKDRSEAEKKFKEYELLKFYEEKKELMKHPKLVHLMWEVTTRCNARCEHCTSSCDNHNQVDEVDIKYVKKALAEIAEAYDPSKIFFVATGGEPLLRTGLFEVVDYAHSLGFRWGMSTNGSLLTKSMVKKLKEHHLESVNISIDGLKDTHEAFRKLPGFWDKIWEGVRMLQEEPAIPIIQVTTVANKKNINELEDIYQFLLKKNIQLWRVLSVDDNGRASTNREILLDGKDYDYLFDFIEKKNAEKKMKQVTYGCSNYLGFNYESRVRGGNFICMPGLVIAAILSDGNIFVCPNVSKRPELMQGNIMKDNFVDVWENRFQYFRDENRMANPKCLACYHWKYCLGGSLHTWNFDTHEQEFCMKEKLSNFE